MYTFQIAIDHIVEYHTPDLKFFLAQRFAPGLVQDLEIAGSANPNYQQPGFQHRVFTISTPLPRLPHRARMPSTILGVCLVPRTWAHIGSRDRAIYDLDHPRFPRVHLECAVQLYPVCTPPELILVDPRASEHNAAGFRNRVCTGPAILTMGSRAFKYLREVSNQALVCGVDDFCACFISIVIYSNNESGSLAEAVHYGIGDVPA